MNDIQDTLSQALFFVGVADPPDPPPVVEGPLPTTDPVIFALVLMAFVAFLKH